MLEYVRLFSTPMARNQRLLFLEKEVEAERLSLVSIGFQRGLKLDFKNHKLQMSVVSDGA